MRTRPPYNHVPVLLFLFQPFIAVVSALRNYKARNSVNLLWFFIIFYGYTFVISSDQLDSRRYAQNLATLSTEHATTVAEFFDLLYKDETNYVDVVEPLLTFLISRFTDSARVLFAFFGLIFGYFYSRNLWFLLSAVRHSLKKEAIVFLVLFAFMVAIWQINGFRFWTAAHVFIYGLFRLANGARRSGALFAALSVFVHFSFVLPLAVLLVYLIVGKRVLLCFGLYMGSFFLSQATPLDLSAYFGYLPPVFQDRTEKYTSEAYLEHVAKPVQVNWYVDGRIAAVKYALNFLLIVLFLKYRAILGRHYVAASLLCLGLLLGTLVNFLGGLPSIMRFQSISQMALLAGLFVFVQSFRTRLFAWWVKMPVYIAAVLFIVVEIRIGFDTMGTMTVIGNPVVASFVEGDIPLIDLIKPRQ